MNSKNITPHTHPIWNWINWFSFPIVLLLAINILQPQDPTSQSSVPSQSTEPTLANLSSS